MAIAFSVEGFNDVVAGLLNYGDRLHAYEEFVFHHQHDGFALLRRVMHVPMTA
jgi:hypothetical protein